MDTMAAVWSLLDARTVLVGVLVFVVLYRMLRRPRHLPPGPMSWPVVGNLPQILMSGEELFEYCSSLTSRYGNVVRINLVGIPMVILHGHNLIKEAFARHQLSHRPTAYMMESMYSGIGIVSASGKQWIEIRRFATNALRGLGVGKSDFEQNIATEAEILVKELKKQEGKAFDPRHVLGNAVSNIICSAVFGKRFQYDDPLFERLLKVTGDIVSEVGAGTLMEVSPIFKHLKFLPFVKVYVKAVENFHNLIHRLLKEHADVQDTDHPRDLIDLFLREKNTKEKQGEESLAFSDENLKHIVADLFGAGSETTATTLRWILLYMMAYTDVQVRVQRELDEVTGRNRFPRISDKPNLPYTDAVISEVQRIQTLVPFALPHLSSEDTSVSGYTIPKGTIVVSNIWHNHVDPLLWEIPREFKPERFLDTNGKFQPREELAPFGIGRRVCPGEQLARMELFIFFTYLLHHFTIRKPDQVPEVSFKGINGTVWAPASFDMCAFYRD